MTSAPTTGSDVFRANMTALRARHARLASMVDQFPDKDSIRVFKALDGSIAYGLASSAGVAPITNPHAPVAHMAAQFSKFHNQLTDLTRPILIVGLYPGQELIYVFNLAETSAITHARQPIHVCIDSIPCLYAFLNTFDAVSMFNSDRVHWIWHEDLSSYVDEFRRHPEWPHNFTPLSGSTNGIVGKVVQTISPLIRERDAETRKLIEANNAYYDSITDDQLAETIAGRGARKPRLMMPTCSWSTVIQYSARDTCAMFDKAGWEVNILKVDAALTPYHLVKSIHEFKPDVFLFIDHLRTEATSVYPRNMMLVSWIQDTMPHIQSRKAAETWNATALEPDPRTNLPRRRDLIVGYVGDLQACGYPADRLRFVPMIINTDIFKPRTLTSEQKAKYACDVMFASNKSLPSDRVVRERLAVDLAAHGLDEKVLMEIHDFLWREYRAEKTFTGYSHLHKALTDNIPSFAAWCSSREKDIVDDAVRRIFWMLNDTIYRHIVLEWLDEHAVTHGNFTLHLYGQGWENHPRFSRYAMGQLSHGEELSVAYQTARHCLHLNGFEGGHQRIGETTAAGGRILTRGAPDTNMAIRKKLAGCIYGATPRLRLTSDDEKMLRNWLAGVLRQAGKPNGMDAAMKLLHHTIWRQTVNALSAQEAMTFFRGRADLCTLFDPGATTNGLHNVSGKPAPGGPTDSTATPANMAEIITTDIVSYLGDSLTVPVSVSIRLRRRAIYQILRSICDIYLNPQKPPAPLPPDQAAFNKAIALAKAGKLDEAEEAMRKLYATNKTIKDGLSIIAWEHKNAGRNEIACARLREEYAMKRQTPAWTVNFANALLDCRNAQEARTIIRKVKPDALPNAYAKYNYAIAISRAGQMQEAERIMRRAYALEPKLKDGLSRIGWAWKTAGNLKKARSLLARDLASKRQTPGWTLNFAELALSMGDRKTAGSLARAINHSQLPSEAVRIRHALLTGKTGNLRKATKLIEGLYKSNPALKDIQSQLGEYYITADKPDTGRALIQQDLAIARHTEKNAIRLATLLLQARTPRLGLTIFDAMGPSRKAESLLQFAVSQARNGNIDIARRWLPTIDPHDLTKAELRHQLGEFLMRTGNHNSALNVFNYSETVSELSRHHFVLKALTFKCLWDIDNAHLALQSGIRTGHDSPLLRIWQARLALLTGNNTTAQQILDTVIQQQSVSPSEKELYFNDLAVIQRSLGSIDDSLHLFTERKPAGAKGHWLCSFEHSLTLCAAGRRPEAIHEADLGAAMVAAPDNQCAVLSEMLRSDGAHGRKANIKHSVWLDSTRKSISPFLPYAAYIAVWTAHYMSQRERSAGMRSVMDVIRPLVTPSQGLSGMTTRQRQTKQSGVSDSSGFSKVAAAIHPFLPLESFEVQMLADPSMPFHTKISRCYGRQIKQREPVAQ